MRQRAARFVLAGTFAAKGILVTAGMNTAARKATIFPDVSIDWIRAGSACVLQLIAIPEGDMIAY
jgi:hypothetical protein